MRPPPTLVGPPLESVPGIGSLTLGGFLAEVAERSPDHPALVFDDPLTGETVRWTYADLLGQSRRVAKALLAAGLGKGARVGILMANRPEAVASLFGAALAGAVAVPLSTFSPRPELAWLLSHADLGALLLQARMGERDFAADVAALDPVADPSFPWLGLVATVGTVGTVDSDEHDWDAFLATGDGVGDDRLDAAAERVHPGDPGVVIHSSGTTDRPKGVVHTHRAVALQWWLQAPLFDRDPGTVVLCPLPLFWAAGLNLALGASLAGGATWVMQEGFDAGQTLRLLERERVTEPHLLPHQFRALEEHPDWADTDLSSCTKVFGKSVFTRHPTVQGDTAWNMPIGYGTSETCSFVAALPWTTPRVGFKQGSYGRLLPGTELRVVDPATGDVLGPDEEGELVVRGPTVMERYVGRTRDESLDADGWFHTGDSGRYDADGLVYFDGRRTEMIKTGGASVSPAEIEVQLQAHEAVKVARVVAVPDERREQLVVLCVELKEGAVATEEEIKAFLAERLAAYKVPKRVLFFPEQQMPMSPNGTKVDTGRLLGTVRERLGVAS